MGDTISTSAFWVGQAGFRGHVLQTETLLYDHGRAPAYRYSVVVSGHPTAGQLDRLARLVVERAQAKGAVSEAWVYFYDYPQAVGLLGPSLGAARYGYPLEQWVEQTASPQALSLVWHVDDWSKQPTEREVLLYFAWLKAQIADPNPNESPTPGRLDRRIARSYGVSVSYLQWLKIHVGGWFNPPGAGYRTA